MTGYQEILTDPSYTGQIVNLTYPHIGNVGVNNEDTESGRIYAAGLVIETLSPIVSNFRAKETLSEYLTRSGVVGIAEVDNRLLTQIIRDRGAQAACILTAANGTLTDEELNAAVEAAKSYTGMVGQDLAQVVTTKAPYEWTEGTWQIDNDTGATSYTKPELPFHIVAYDFGVKQNILRLLVNQGLRVPVRPRRLPLKTR